MHTWTTLEQAAASLRSLHSQAKIAEYEFLVACMTVEDSPLWKGSESARDVTFGAWLERNDICEASYYDRRAAGLLVPEIRKVSSVIGIDAVPLVAEVRNPEKRKLVLRAFVKAAAESDKQLAATTARNIRDAIVGDKMICTSTVDEKIEHLKAENVKLKAEVKRLKAENRELRERLNASMRAR